MSSNELVIGTSLEYRVFFGATVGAAVVAILLGLGTAVSEIVLAIALVLLGLWRLAIVSVRVRDGYIEVRDPLRRLVVPIDRIVGVGMESTIASSSWLRIPGRRCYISLTNGRKIGLEATAQAKFARHQVSTEMLRDAISRSTGATRVQ